MQIIKCSQKLKTCSGISSGGLALFPVTSSTTTNCMPCANALYPWINSKRKTILLHSMISSQYLIQSLHLSMAFAYLSCVLFCFVFYLYLSEFFLHDFLTWWYKQYFSVNISFTEVQFSKSLSQVTCQRFPRCGSVKFKVCLNCLPPSFRLKFSLTLLLQILLPLTPLELLGKSCPELEKNKSNLDFPWSCQRWNTKKGAFHNSKKNSSFA